MAVTRNIEVRVQTAFLPEHSDPLRRKWLFAYHIQIRNLGTETVQVLSRHWTITNALGSVEQVRGAGVVGEQPVLEPGEAFEYTSYCPLDTSLGVMHGTYQLVTADGERFDAVIAPFSLLDPSSEQ